MYYKDISARQEQVNEQILKLEKEIAKYPKNELICVQNGKYTKWFQTDGHNPIYIPKRDRELAEALAQKKYLTCQLEVLQKEQKANAQYLKHHKTSKSISARELLIQSGYKELLSKNFQPISEELSEWVKVPYQGNTNHPENLTQPTSIGIKVRSKSEALIVAALHAHRIPFHYEEALMLGRKMVYPDFTIRHPRTGKTYYWEHLGMMDREDYRKKNLNKLNDYVSNGIIPSESLILTYETDDIPLDMELVENYIEYYFG